MLYICFVLCGALIMVTMGTCCSRRF